MFSGGQAGFNLHPTKLQVVEIVNRGGQYFVENVDEAFFPESINFETDKESRILSVIQAGFNELAVKKSFQSSSVSFTLPLELFNVIQIPYDNSLIHPDLMEDFRFHFSLMFPYIPAKELAIQYIEAEKGNFSEINTAIVVGIQRKYLQIIENFCRQNKLELKFVDNAHSASERALSVSHPVSEQNLVLSVFFTGKAMSLIYSSLGRVINFKIISIADPSDIPLHIEKESKAAGYLKVEKDQIDGAYLCGEDLSPASVESLKKVLKINFIHFNPFANLQPGSGVFKNRNYTDRANSFSPAAGIAIRTA